MTPLEQALAAARGTVEALERMQRLEALAAVAAAGGDATDALQALLDHPREDGVVEIPAGVYRVDTTRGVRPRSGTRVLAGLADLQAIPTDATSGAIVLFDGAEDVSWVGGRIVGERDRHLGTTGEKLHGMLVKGGKGIRIEGVAVRDCWGDGISIGFNAQDVAVRDSEIVLCRRNGLTVGRVVGCTVEDCRIAGTNGTTPQAGIDIEPDVPGQARGIVIRRCVIEDNQGYGITAFHRTTDGGLIDDVTLEANIIRRNSHGIVTYGGTAEAGARAINIIGNTIEDNRASGLRVRVGSDGVAVSGNRFARNYRKAARPAEIEITGMAGVYEADILIEKTGVTNLAVGANRYG